MVARKRPAASSGATFPPSAARAKFSSSSTARPRSAAVEVPSRTATDTKSMPGKKRRTPPSSTVLAAVRDRVPTFSTTNSGSRQGSSRVPSPVTATAVLSPRAPPTAVIHALRRAGSQVTALNQSTKGWARSPPAAASAKKRSQRRIGSRTSATPGTVTPSPSAGSR